MPRWSNLSKVTENREQNKNIFVMPRWSNLSKVTENREQNKKNNFCSAEMESIFFGYDKKKT